MRDVAELKLPADDVGSPFRLGSVVVGVLAGFESDSSPLVDFPGNPGDNAIPARLVGTLSQEDVGREIALLFEGADPTKPVVVGVIAARSNWAPRNIDVQRDAERIELTADREIVLRCGPASITLTRAGKILIRGAYVSSHSSGTNRVKGAAVHIN